MATLEIARRSWWDDATREEQEEYLRTHPRSKLKITKRRKKKKNKNAKDEPKQEEEKPEEQVPAKEGEAESAPVDDAPAADTEEKDADDKRDGPVDDVTADQVDGLKEADALQSADPVDLSPEEEDAISEQLKELAPDLEPEKVSEQLSDQDKHDIEDDLQDAIDEPDDNERVKKFAKAGLRLGLRLGLIAASVTLVAATGGPTALLLPQVYGTIWHKSDDWSRSSTDLLSSAVGVLHKTFKNGTRGYLKGSVRKQPRRRRPSE